MDKLKISKIIALIILKKYPDYKIFRRFDKDRKNKPGLTPEEIKQEKKNPLLLFIPDGICVIDLDLKSKNHKQGLTPEQFGAFIKYHDLQDYPATQTTKSGGSHYFFKTPEGFTHKSSGIQGVDLKCEGNLIGLYEQELWTEGKYEKLTVMPSSIVNHIELAKTLPPDKKPTGNINSNDLLNTGFKGFATLPTKEERDALEETIYERWVIHKEKKGAKTTESEARKKISKSREDGEKRNPYVNLGYQNKIIEAQKELGQYTSLDQKTLKFAKPIIAGIQDKKVKFHGVEVLLYKNSDDSYQNFQVRLDLLEIKSRYNTLVEKQEYLFEDYIKNKLPGYEGMKKFINPPQTGEWKDEYGKKWIGINDVLETRLTEIIERHTGILERTKEEEKQISFPGADKKFQVKRPKLKQHDVKKLGLAIASHNSVNPFVEWLNKVYRENKDKVPDKNTAEILFKKVLNGCFSFKYDELGFLAISGTLTACIARQLQPGAKWDIVPLLCGKAGIGKTEFWKHLFENNSPYYVQDLIIQEDQKKTLEKMRGAVMGELSEYGFAGKKEVSKTKSFVTTRGDTDRFSYDRYPDHRPRKFVLVGTTNHSRCVPDEEGSARRFAIVEVDPLQNSENSASDMIHLMNNGGREYLWACAMRLFQERWLDDVFFPLEEIIIANKEKHIRINEEAVNIVKEWIEDKEKKMTDVPGAIQEDNPQLLKFDDAMKTLNSLGLTYNNRRQAVTQAFNSLGYEKKKDRTGKKRWIKGKNSEDPA